MSEDQRFKVSFDRTDAQLEWFWLFAVAVAGKNADTTARGLDSFLAGWRGSPYRRVEKVLQAGTSHIRSRGAEPSSDDCTTYLGMVVRASGLGQYGRVARAWVYSIQNLTDLRGCSLDQLMACPGVGPKTARFFLTFTRPDQRYAVLDVHVLRWLAAQGVEDVPKSTPPAGPRYDRLEREFLRYCEAIGMSPAEVDWRIWVTSRKQQEKAA